MLASLSFMGVSCYCLMLVMYGDFVHGSRWVFVVWERVVAEFDLSVSDTKGVVFLDSVACIVC